MCNQELELASMQNSWGQGTAQTSSHSAQPTPARASGDVSFTSLACASFDTLLSAPLPSSSNIGDHRRSSAKAPHPNEVLKCPRCESLDTKFCYYNNYSLTQPRYFCKNCKRYWTAGGALRNVPVGGGLRKNKRSKLKMAAAAAAAAADAEAARVAQQGPGHGMQPQSGQSVVDGEASQISENRASPLPASGALPSHVVVGVPEISHLYGHPTGEMCAMNCHAGRNLSSSASQCSVENIVSQNGARAPASILPAQAGNFYCKEDANAAVAFFCDPNQIPQFYSSYAAGVSMPFSSATVPSGSVPGYAVNYSFFTADPCRITDKEERCSNTCETAMGRIGSTAVDSSIGELKQEKDEAQAPVNTYDWQLISEGLFNGTGSSDSNFLYTPSSSWPDFSQFNDAGPG